MRTRSPSRAPPEKGEDGSTARTPTRLPPRRSSVTRALVAVDLPTPGEPVIPTTWAWPACGTSAAMTSRSWGERSSTIETSRATARGSPPRALATRSSILSVLRDTDDQGVALAATAAECGGTHSTAAALELEGQGEDDPGTGHADGVTEGDRSAVHVDLVVVQ